LMSSSKYLGLSASGSGVMACLPKGGPAVSPEIASQNFSRQRDDYIAHTNSAQAAGGHGGMSSNAYANGANQNCGNVLTDRRTTKVLAPPGGHSSIVFG